MERSAASPAIKIGIYLSIFNVHVNRIPESAQVISVEHHPGVLHPVTRPQAPQVNEQLWLLLEAPSGVRMLIKQIAGAFASRVVCELRPGQVVERGQKYGMIKFGSRVELYLASEPDLKILVKPKQKVRGGCTLLGQYG